MNCFCIVMSQTILPSEFFFTFANTLPYSLFLFESKSQTFAKDNPLHFSNIKAKSLHHLLQVPNKTNTIGSMFPFLFESNLQLQIQSDIQNQKPFESVIAKEKLHFYGFQNHPYLLKLTQLDFNFYTITIEELTDAVLAEKILKQKESKLDRLLKTMINGVVVVNKEGQILYANDSASEILELELASIENRYFSSREWKQIYEDGSPYPTDKLPLAQALGDQLTVYNCEHGILSEEGHVKWLNVNATPLFDEYGNLEGATASFLDITELKKNQTTIEQQNKKLKSVLEAIEKSAIVSVTNPDGIIIRANSKFIQITGFPENEIIGSDHKIFSSDYHKKEFWKGLWNQIKHGKTWEGIIKNKSKDGNYFWLQTFIHPLFNSEEKIEAYLSIRFDITEEIVALENTKRMLHFTGIQNNRLQNFAYILSHNIRQHSSNFTSLIQLLEESKSEVDKKNIVEMLHASSVKLEETISHLNDIISINQTLNQPMEICSLKNEVNKTLSILSGSIEHRNIKIITIIPDELKVKTIPNYLESILLNLLSNAVKYVRLKEGAWIKIQIEENQDQIQIKVEDNGLGINLEKHGNKIFGMFKTFHRNEDARGIGLFITKSQVEVLGGKITLQSEEGKGSLFSVSLPKNPEESLRV
ncbi:Sensor protein of a two component response regulator [Leptospira biflexa serovar Patoc strain 'Patoc 1 (Ames)']|uniref:histidine kinase n=2 Tax=Leptospira biflexa TaxID=172 RepID=B0SSR7_LEPBP|nr:Sensor protein of a two component response regulator [Leptospira biflexa serovar Patoc strain 'Patoc 1 (Ames)']ABZ98157.1 Putative bacterial sensor [Leptospira biflexa serovar Patoc strain 'Patoc 1 (Paris)']